VALSKGKRLLGGYGAVLCLIVLIVAAARACTLHTVAYSVAEKFATSDLAVLARFGSVGRVSLKAYKFYSCRDAEQCDEFTLSVVGTRDRGTISVHERKNQGVWTVTSAYVMLPGGTLAPLK
jgi:hypothetical protein